MSVGGKHSVVLTVPISEIGELPADHYVGLIDESAIACLEARFAVEGLKSPIWVRRNGNAARTRWSVIAGRHRLRAAQRLGWTEIAIEQRADAKSTLDELRSLQVTENLDRRVLRPIERALNLMVRRQEASVGIDCAVAKNQHAAAAVERWSASATVADALPGVTTLIDEATAAACGVSLRTIQSYRKIHSAIVEPFADLYPALNAHHLGESLSVMTRIAQEKKAEERRAIIEAIISDPQMPSVDEARVRLKLSTPKGHREKTDYDRQVASILQKYRAVDLDRQRATIADLASHSCETMLHYMIEQAREKLAGRNAL